MVYYSILLAIPSIILVVKKSRQLIYLLSAVSVLYMLDIYLTGEIYRLFFAGLEPSFMIFILFTLTTTILRYGKYIEKKKRALSPSKTALLCGLFIFIMVLSSLAVKDWAMYQHQNQLIEASKTGNKNLAEFAISYGAYKDIKDATGKSPIDYAKENNHTEVLKLLESANKWAQP